MTKGLDELNCVGVFIQMVTISKNERPIFWPICPYPAKLNISIKFSDTSPKKCICNITLIKTSEIMWKFASEKCAQHSTNSYNNKLLLPPVNISWNCADLCSKPCGCPEHSQKSGRMYRYSCRAWKTLQTEPFVANIGVDTTESGPLKSLKTAPSERLQWWVIR